MRKMPPSSNLCPSRTGQTGSFSSVKKLKNTEYTSEYTSGRNIFVSLWREETNAHPLLILQLPINKTRAASLLLLCTMLTSQNFYLRTFSIHSSRVTAEPEQEMPLFTGFLSAHPKQHVFSFQEIWTTSSLRSLTEDNKLQLINSGRRMYEVPSPTVLYLGEVKLHVDLLLHMSSLLESRGWHSRNML